MSDCSSCLYTVGRGSELHCTVLKLLTAKPNDADESGNFFTLFLTNN